MTQVQRNNSGAESQRRQVSKLKNKIVLNVIIKNVLYLKQFLKNMIYLKKEIFKWTIILIQIKYANDNHFNMEGMFFLY